MSDSKRISIPPEWKEQFEEARLKGNNAQINITIPSEWKEPLEDLARIYSGEKGTTIPLPDLIRKGIQEKVQLKENTGERGTKPIVLRIVNFFRQKKHNNSIKDNRRK